MRAIDAKTLDELGMLYGDKNCFSSLRDWFETAEPYWTNIERLFTVADYAKKQDTAMVEKIDTYSTQIVELFHQTKDYASAWDSKNKEKHEISTDDYTAATNENWDALDNWTDSQEELQDTILEFIKLLYSVVSKQ